MLVCMLLIMESAKFKKEKMHSCHVVNIYTCNITKHYLYQHQIHNLEMPEL